MNWYPHSSSAFWYGGAAWSNDTLSDVMDDNLLLMLSGMFFVVVGEWCSRGGRIVVWFFCSG